MSHTESPDFERATEAREILHEARADRELIKRLKLELAARAIRTMGPRSPYWNCTICGASKTTPIHFQHKPDCLLADTPNPVALVAESAHRHFYSIEVQHAQLLAIVRQAVDAVDSGNLEMNSPEIGEPENDIPMHPWHEEWLHHARSALASAE